MVTFPNAKINLGLTVTGKRPDGFHNLATVFYPVGLCDALEVIPAQDGITGFHSTGLPIPGDPGKNLCIVAYHLVSEDHRLPPVKIHLHKVIPIGSGLGGGSSDGAYCIRLLDSVFRLGISVEKMMGYARKLGSDCAFFIRNEPVFAFEKGDHFSPVHVNLSGYRILIVVPPVHVSTKEAYSLLTPGGSPGKSPLRSIVEGNIAEWKGKLVNDFESPIFVKYPEIERIRENLYRSGAFYASMSGSGSAVYGIFPEGPVPYKPPPGYFSWISGHRGAPGNSSIS
jgi:4-diphosphocytidyl-2-C-methyl-D-erythritol kinase